MWLVYAYGTASAGPPDPNEGATFMWSQPPIEPPDAKEVYWLNIVAVYRDDSLQAVTRPWGWTGRPHAFGSPAQSMGFKEDGRHVDSLSSPAGPVDMAFTLYTQSQIGGSSGL